MRLSLREHHAAPDTVSLDPTRLGARLPGLRERLAVRAEEWERRAARNLAVEFPLQSHERVFKGWRARLENQSCSPDQLPDAVDDHIAFCRAAGIPANEAYWRRLHVTADGEEGILGTKLRAASLVSQKQLVQEWHKGLAAARTEWELARIEELRAEFLAEIEAMLETLRSLTESLEALGLEPGRLLDFTSGKLSAQDISEFQRWAHWLAENEEVRALCDMLGRMRRIEMSERIERVKSSRPIRVPVPDIDSREEIVGIRLGRDLVHTLPSELGLLADPETEVLFDVKLLEGRLMCFDMRGETWADEEEEFEEERNVAEEEKLGPIVLCVDTSGSMHGTPEAVAKAVALFMASKAQERDRPCYLINFSTGIETLDFSGRKGLQALIRFLGMSFQGGTDAEPALRHALGIMEKERYSKADLLIVSDFVMDNLREETTRSIVARRKDGCRFHSLVIGAPMSAGLRDIFDEAWAFDPRSGGIRGLVDFGWGIGSRIH